MLEFFGLFILVISAFATDPACKDNEGNDVDWFVAIKIPNMPDPKFASASQWIKRGQAYYYADAKNQDFKIASMSINSSESAIGRTVQQAIDAFKAKDQVN
jgi:hypothetical protein